MRYLQLTLKLLLSFFSMPCPSENYDQWLPSYFLLYSSGILQQFILECTLTAVDENSPTHMCA